VSTIGERIAAAYDRVAADYAIINAAMPANLATLGEQFLAHLGPNPRVLDAGCGVGRDMAWMEARGAQVTGIDLSGGMLDLAGKTVHGPLLRMDMCRLALPTGQFDGVWCCASLLHVPKARAAEALAEMRRVLVPGGVLYLGIQEGEGETWESGGPFGAVERLFARYAPDEAEALLLGIGFTIDERGRDEAGTRRWLSMLATAPKTPSQD